MPPGLVVKLGSASRARFTLPELPRNLKRRTCASKSAGSTRGSRSWRNVRRTSAEEITTPAGISSPLSRTTPVARSRAGESLTRLTPAPVRISAPCARAALAIAALIAPVPPLCRPQARKAPSISPM